MVIEVYHKLGSLLTNKYDTSAKNLGDEGSFAPALSSPEEALLTIEDAIKEAGYKPGKDTFIGLDTASSEFYDS